MMTADSAIHDDASFDVVAIASSAGGVNALSQVLSKLPADFPAALLVVQHLDPGHRSHLPDILSRRCKLRIKQAEEGDTIEKGTAYIAPPDNHLLADADAVLTLTHTELVHFVRPSADLLFESVAAAYGERSIALVLTGTGQDGRMGTEAIKSRGGFVIVQDPETAEFSGMPRAAVESGAADLVLDLGEIPETLLDLVKEGRGEGV